MELLKLLLEEAVCNEVLLAFFFRVDGLEAEAGVGAGTLDSRVLEDTCDASGICRESALPTRIDTG